MPRRLTGLPKGAIDAEKHEIRLELGISGGKPLPFVAKFGVASQIASGLSRMVRELETIMRSQKAATSTAIERIAEAHVQKERWEDLVLLRFVSVGGVPYTFGIPATEAAELADRLRTESAKPTETGRA